jgi:hypothetical protein
MARAQKKGRLREPAWLAARCYGREPFVLVPPAADEPVPAGELEEPLVERSRELELMSEPELDDELAPGDVAPLVEEPLPELIEPLVEPLAEPLTDGLEGLDGLLLDEELLEGLVLDPRDADPVAGGVLDEDDDAPVPELLVPRSWPQAASAAASAETAQTLANVLYFCSM